MLEPLKILFVVKKVIDDAKKSFAFYRLIGFVDSSLRKSCFISSGNSGNQILVISSG